MAFAIGLLLFGASAWAQQKAPSVGALNPVGGSGNVWTPGIPSNSGAQNAQPATRPGDHRGGGGRPRGVGSRSGYNGASGNYGGAYFVPYPVAGPGGYTVFNPPPGEYDPIFGVYNPGVYSPGPGGYNPSVQPTPTVIINQNFQPGVVSPQLRDYSNVMLPPPGPQASPVAPIGTSIDSDTALILIAMKDHTIYPALAYWVQGDTLNYVMVGGAVNHASITAVDRELTAKLNAERNVEFHLPQSKNDGK